MNFVKLENDKLDVSSITDLVADEACGAISVFVGITRDNFEDKKVVSLEYEAYEPMAVKSLTALCDELRTKWPDIKHIAIHHRLGSVPVKEKSIVIAISSPHRETSLHAVHHAIDTLKTTIPIWKKECYDDSQTTWKENKESSAVSSKTRLERSQLNFESCPCDAAPISKNLVQITADEAELTRRIQCFVEKKREEIDTENISCFTEKLPTNIDQSEVAGSCARVNSTVFRQKDSDGYVKVRRVKNEIGPQIKPDYASTLNKLMGNTLMPRVKQERVEASSFESLPPGLEERLENVEKFLGQNTKPAPRTLYERVKNVEDRLLYLESISPEYYHFLGEKPPPDDMRRRKKPNYSVEDLDRYIADIQKNI